MYRCVGQLCESLSPLSFQYLDPEDDTRCLSCPLGTLPDGAHLDCVQLPEQERVSKEQFHFSFDVKVTQWPHSGHTVVPVYCQFREG